MTTSTATPAWLKQHLIDIGAWSADGISRRAQPRRHPCGRIVLTGLDDDLAAFPATVDIHELTPLGEALAILAGRDTYDYRPIVSELNGPRRARRITWSPATNTGPVRVLVAHQCDAPDLPHFAPEHSKPKEHHDQPPY